MKNRHSAHKREWFFEEPSRLNNAAYWAACGVASGLQFICGNRCKDGFGILMYHRIVHEVPGVESPTLNVTPQQLLHQLTGLLERGFECWSLNRLIVAHREKGAVPPNAFAITFDDGYENNYVNAWPILRELNLPATIFVATQYLETQNPFPFDDWQLTGSRNVPVSAWRPLSIRQCKEMLDGGLVEIGAHTHSHKKFLGRSGEFRRDMQLCLDVLHDRFGIERPPFAFPYGYTSPELVEAAKQAGVACSLSTRGRRVLPGEDEYQWGRFWVDSSDTPTKLAAKICWYSTVANMGKPILAKLERVASNRLGNYLPGSVNSETHRVREEPSSP